MSTWTTHLGPFVLDNSGVNLQADFISWKMRQSMSLMWLRASALKAGVNILEPALVGLLSHNGGLSKTPEKDGQVSLDLSRLGCCPWWSSRRSKMSGLLHFLAFPSVGRIDFLWSSGVKVFTPKSGKQLAAFSFPFKSSSKSLWVATWEPLLALCGDWSGFRRLGHMLALSLAKLGRLQPWMESLLDCVVWAPFLTMGDGLIPCFSVGLLCLRFSKSKLTMRSGGVKSVAFVHVDNLIFIILSFFLMLDHFFSFFQQTTTKNNKKKQKKTKQTKKKQKRAKKSQNEQK